MAFCGSCGTQIGDGVAFCPKCGSAQAAGAPARPANPGAVVAPAAVQPTSSTGMTDNVAGALAYLFAPFGGILFLVLEPYNKHPFVRFHAFQSIFFGVAAIAFRIALVMVVGMLFAFGGALFSLMWGLIWIVQLGLFGVWILVVYKAYNKEEYKLPIIGDLAAKQAGQ